MRSALYFARLFVPAFLVIWLAGWIIFSVCQSIVTGAPLIQCLTTRTIDCSIKDRP